MSSNKQSNTFAGFAEYTWTKRSTGEKLEFVRNHGKGGCAFKVIHTDEGESEVYEVNIVGDEISMTWEDDIEVTFKRIDGSTMYEIYGEDEEDFILWELI